MFCSECGADMGNATTCPQCGAPTRVDRQRLVMPGEAFRRLFTRNWVCRGRASRSEFWFGALWLSLSSVCWIGLFAVAMTVFLDRHVDAATGHGGEEVGGLVSFLYYHSNSPILLVPLVLWLCSMWLYGVMTVRRLHDLGRTGWWVGCYWLSYLALVVCNVASAWLGIPALASFGAVPALAGWALALVLLVFSCLPSKPLENRYGPVPNLLAAGEARNERKEGCAVAAGIGCLAVFILMGFLIVAIVTFALHSELC